MTNLKRLRNIISAIAKKEADFEIDTDERGEVVIYTGLVENKGKYREAKMEERHDFEILQEAIEEEANLLK